MDFKILPFELKSASGDGSQFSGYANCFHNIDAAQEIVAMGAFKDTLAQFMDVGFIGGLNHSWDCPIGKPVSAVEDMKGLFVEGKISATMHGQDCMVLLKDNVIKKMSIGYRVEGTTELADAEEVASYWKDNGYTPNTSDIALAQRGATVLTKLFLYEFSPVTVPANLLADITRVKRYRAEFDTERDFERFLRDVGLSRKEATGVTLHGFKGLQRDAEEAAMASEEISPPIESEIVVEAEPETIIEEKVEPVVIPPIIIDVAMALHQAQVQSLYADFLKQKARLIAR